MDRFIGLLAMALLVLCLVLVNSMSEQLDRHVPEGRVPCWESETEVECAERHGLAVNAWEAVYPPD